MQTTQLTAVFPVRPFARALPWILAYVLAVLLANLTLDWFFPLPFFGLLAVGTLFFAAIFTLRDRLHQLGLRYVFVAIVLALLVNILVALVLHIPARFIIASFISILLSELTDTLVFEKFKQYSTMLRALSSNAISVPLDSALFSLLAFYGLETWATLVQIIFADILVKFILAAALAFILFYRRHPNQLKII